MECYNKITVSLDKEVRKSFLIILAKSGQEIARASGIAVTCQDISSHSPDPQ
jgi:hypothetical protein